MTSESGNRIWAWILGGGVLVVLGLGYAWKAGSGTTPELRPAHVADAGPGGIDVVSDAERAEYLQQFVRVSNVVVAGDSFVDAEGKTREVSGLMSVTGDVENTGAKAIAAVVLAFYPEDDAGKVLAAYQNDISMGRRLAPGEKKSFKFTIPARKGWGGKFRHKLQ